MLGGADDSVRHRNGRNANRVDFRQFQQHRSLYVLFISYPGSWIITIILQVICYHMKNLNAWYQREAYYRCTFTGLILGILTGLFLADRFTPILTVTGVIGGIYMNALNMMIFPMVFCSIVMGICSIGNAKTTGKITGYSMIFFLCTTAIASAVGIIIPRLIRLGKGVHFEMATSDIQATEMTSILDTIKNLIPSNPVKLLPEGNMLQVLVFAVIIGFTLIAVGRREASLNVIDSLNEVCLKVISTVMYFTPIGVFCTIVPVVEANGTKTIVSLATQLIILYVAFYGFAIVVYGGAVKLIGKTSPVKFFKAIMPAALNAFGTCSSSATIPISKRCVEKELGVSKPDHQYRNPARCHRQHGCGIDPDVVYDHVLRKCLRHQRQHFDDGDHSACQRPAFCRNTGYPGLQSHPSRHSPRWQAFRPASWAFTSVSTHCVTWVPHASTSSAIWQAVSLEEKIKLEEN